MQNLSAPTDPLKMTILRIVLSNGDVVHRLVRSYSVEERTRLGKVGKRVRMILPTQRIGIFYNIVEVVEVA